MAHQNQSLCALLQESLKPTDTLDVEVVGRLVEQQYVGASQQNLCQLDTHTPAAAELLRRAVEVVACESQTGKCALYLCLVVVATHHHVVVVLLREPLHQFGIFRAFEVGALSHLLVELLYLRLQLSRVGKRLACFLLYGRVILQHHHLRQIADSGVCWYSHIAFSRLLQPAYNLQHRRFAGAVLAHKCYAVAVVHHETYVAEQRFNTKLY